MDMGLGLTRVHDNTDWTPFPPYMALATTISRAMARMLGGTELSSNDEWVQMHVNLTIVAHQAAQEIRKYYPRPLRWLAPWLDAGSKDVLANRRRAAEIVQPIIDKQLQASDDVDTGEPDAIQWWLGASAGRTPTALQIADDFLFLGIASIHSSSATSLSILYDLLDRPETTREILNEIQTTHSECPGGRWTREALTRLERLDSFMAESFRFRLAGSGKKRDLFFAVTAPYP